MGSQSNGSSSGHSIERSRPRFWLALQPSIVRIYKIAGLIALTAILIGLVGFLIVNIFYFFNHTWVRPVVIDKSSQKVIEASTQLSDANLRKTQIEAERMEIQTQQKELHRSVEMNEKFLQSVGASADKPGTAEQWLVHREVERARFDKANAEDRFAPLELRGKSLEKRAADQDAIIKRLEQSPYLRGIDHKVQLAFVPYSNKEIKIGTKLYGCHWGLVWCKNVGTVSAIIDGEVQDIHPHDESVQRGYYVEINVDKDWEGEAVMFAGSKPLMIIP